MSKEDTNMVYGNDTPYFVQKQLSLSNLNFEEIDGTFSRLIILTQKCQ